ncbi:MAG: hypothetical protein LBS21_04285 [Clostridiales bacterium]|nr:hypothetical protein [Clostridiales bacterium]
MPEPETEEYEDSEEINDSGGESEGIKEDEATEKYSFFGTWRIDKAALISNVNRETTEDVEFQEGSFNPEDYIGCEIEFSHDFIRLGSDTYYNPEYVVSYTAGYQGVNGITLPDFLGLIFDEGVILYRGYEYERLIFVPLLNFFVKFAQDIKYEENSSFPVGSQCVLLNNDTMLLGVWGKTVLAHRVYESEENAIPIEELIDVNPLQPEAEDYEDVKEIEDDADSEEEETIDYYYSFYGSWRIDKLALTSKSYTGTTKDGLSEENLFDPEDYIGYEVEYSPDFFRLGSETYFNPEYVVSFTTARKFQYGGGFRVPYLLEFISDEGIVLFGEDKYENENRIPIPLIRIEFEEDIKYGKYSFFPVGSQCALLNEDTMLLGFGGKVMLAHRVK